MDNETAELNGLGESMESIGPGAISASPFSTMRRVLSSIEVRDTTAMFLDGDVTQSWTASVGGEKNAIRPLVSK